MDATNAVYEVLKEMAHSHASKKKRVADDDDSELLDKVSARTVTKETLREKLAQHVEQVSLVVLNHHKCFSNENHSVVFAFKIDKLAI